MRQTKLRRSLILLNKNKDKTNETIKTTEKEKIIEQVEFKYEKLHIQSLFLV
jgi:hypothetical protein